VDPPSVAGLSSEPLKGNYRIECNEEGYEPTYSRDIDPRWGAENINIMMSEGCH